MFAAEIQVNLFELQFLQYFMAVMHCKYCVFEVLFCVYEVFMLTY
jgi:hypothetical protein